MGLGDAIICDRKGAICSARTDLNDEKKALLELSNKADKSGSLADVMVGADLFIGVSSPGVVTPEMVETMAPSSVSRSHSRNSKVRSPQGPLYHTGRAVDDKDFVKFLAGAEARPANRSKLWGATTPARQTTRQALPEAPSSGLVGHLPPSGGKVLKMVMWGAASRTRPRYHAFLWGATTPARHGTTFQVRHSEAKGRRIRFSRPCTLRNNTGTRDADSSLRSE